MAMNTAVAEVDLSPAPPQNPLVAGFNRLDNRRKTGLLLGLALLLGGLMLAFYMNRQGDWRVLYTGLSDKDGGAVIAQLTQMNVPYKHTEGGQAHSWCQPTACTTPGCGWHLRACPKDRSPASS